MNIDPVPERSRSPSRVPAYRALCWLLTLALVTGPAFACGPFFPNSLLEGGDNAVLTAPVAWFSRELSRLKLPPEKFTAVHARRDGTQPTSDRQSTLEADLADLRTALRRANTTLEEISKIVGSYAGEREKVFRNVARQEEAKAAEENGTTMPRKQAPPRLEVVSVPAGVPGEFADYFRGAMHWHSGDTNGARMAWTALLARPAGERSSKSVWAAYMLAKSWETESPSQAIEFYRRTRELAAAGFADTLGLAAESAF